MRRQRTLGRFPSRTPFLFLVRMYLCGYVACIARALAQHCWMCCANEHNIVGPRFVDRETIEMLALKFDQFQTSCNNTQRGVQTLAISWAQQCFVLLANNVASVCTGLYTFQLEIEQYTEVSLRLYCNKFPEYGVKVCFLSSVCK